jgi:sulfate permease, SulP family
LSEAPEIADSDRLARAPAPEHSTRWLPTFDWLRRYDFPCLRADVVAGVTLAAYLLPAAIGDASLARLPAEAGLYACMFSGLIFWSLCSSRRTAITVTSAISLLMGTSLGALANGDASRFGALAACTAMLVALLAFVAWLARAGSLVNFVSETVLIGFKVGVALTLASTQLPKLFGISGAHGGFWECAHHFLTHLHETNPASLIMGCAAIGILVLGKIFLRNKPVALLVVIGGIVAAGATRLGDRGVKMLGDVPQGLPAIGLPSVALSDLNELLPLAMACFLLGAVETAAIGRMFASKHGGRLDANQEFLALAGANLAAGLGQGFPVSGGMSQSLVNESAGARTPISGLVSASMILVVIVFLSGMLRSLPQPVLAAIVLMAVLGLVNVSAINHLWRTDRQELLIVGAALAGVLTSGLLRGVLIGGVISMLLLIRRASRPHVAFLGRIPGTRRYSDIDRHADNDQVPGVLIFRPEGSLVYFNADHVHEMVLAKVRGTTSAPRAVICDLSAAPFVDLGGAEMLMHLEAELRAMGVRLHVVEAHSAVRDKLRIEGIEDRIGRIDRFTSVADIVDAIQSESHSSGAVRADGSRGREGDRAPKHEGRDR